MKNILLCLFIAACYSSFSQADSTHFDHNFYSNAFQAERKITIHLPRRYLEMPKERMMVTYVLDAQGPDYFNMICAIVDYMNSRNAIIPTIIIGIHSPDRFAEFTPFARPGSSIEWEKNFKSQMPSLIEHLQNEVIPWVQSNLRTQPFTSVIGHSRGGSFVTQALFGGHKDLFDCYIALSPVLHFDNFQSIELATAKLQEGEDFNKFYFQSSGDIGETEIFLLDHVEKMEQLLINHPSISLTSYTRYFKGKGHSSIVPPALTEALILLKNEHMVSHENIYKFSKNGSVPIDQQIQNFIETQNNRQKYLHEPGLEYFESLGREFMELEEYNNALSIYNWVASQQPLTKWWDEFNVGKCYALRKDFKSARSHFDKSIKLVDNYKEKYGKRYQSIVLNLKEEIKEIILSEN